MCIENTQSEIDMVVEWRLIGLETNDAYMNMAIDEALVQFVSQGESPNTLRFYRWKPSAISIGFFQSVNEEVNVGACERTGVDVVRRVTGGGAVYHDYQGEVTYSLIASQDDPHVPLDISESYAVLCKGLVFGLKEIGLSSEFKPINDIVVNEKKISGNAQTRKMHAVLQHGTILVNVDVPKMFSLLKVSDEKIRYKMIHNVEERVTSIRRELKRDVDLVSVAQALSRGFEKALQIRLVKGELKDEELTLSQRLRDEKYATRRWTYQR